MIRAFVALSLLVLGLLLYAIKGGHWFTKTANVQVVALEKNLHSNTDKETHLDAKNGKGEVNKKINTKDSQRDELGLAENSPSEDGANYKASADLARLKESQDRAAIQSKENKALVNATQERLQKETEESIQVAKREALADASQQIESKIAAVQASANEKIEKTQTLLEALQQEKQKLASKNDELEKIQQEAQNAAELATDAAAKAHLAVQKTAQILGSKIAVDNEALVASISNSQPTDSGTAEIIRTVDDAKRIAENDKVLAKTTSAEKGMLPSTKMLLRTGKAENSDETTRASLRLSANEKKNPRTAPIVKVAGFSPKTATNLEKDPMTGFPVSYGYSTTEDKKSAILFSFASSSLSDSAKNALTKLLENTPKHAAGKFLVTGFSDGTGSVDAQNYIAHARAQSVKNFLLSLGVSKDAIITASKAAAYLHDNTTVEGRMLNRKVEVIAE